MLATSTRDWILAWTGPTVTRSAPHYNRWRRPRSLRQRGVCRPPGGAQNGAPARAGRADRNLNPKHGVTASIRPRRFIVVRSTPRARAASRGCPSRLRAPSRSGRRR